MIHFLQAATGALFVLILAFIVAWPWLQPEIIRYSLHRHAAEVRRSDRPLADKERLLDRLESLDDRLRDGAIVGTLRWIEAALGGSDIGVESAIGGFPNFEQLEFRGSKDARIQPFLAAMKKLAERNQDSDAA